MRCLLVPRGSVVAFRVGADDDNPPNLCDNDAMTNNDILRRLRYIFDSSDSKMMALFSLAGGEVSRAEVSAWLKREDAEGFEECRDVVLATFLNGLIIERRGRREGPMPEPEQRLNNNIILVKLKVALSLKAEDLVEILGLAGYAASKHEISAFFRKYGSRQYRECKDQILRNFLRGLEVKFHAETDLDSESVTDSNES